MKTEIAAFCSEYDAILEPLVDLLKETSDCIDEESRPDELRATQAGLRDVGMRLKSLADKVKDQQAYLLIFGPLKSGKSTLMNAISGAYVSEVTSLPAYPCLVYVRHGEKAFTVTNYDGKEQHYDSSQALEDAIAKGHATLAEKIREKEHAGGEFDPGVDYPDAIRRVDIRVPITDLVESSTVMVDTPGLYSRMKFGYDLMTREFRDSAACAVFVVKTDNLYLEQVFAEFTDLLDLFSRIFLVVNIDSGKRDLRPDGTLQPSLESQQPQRIIEAFETLAMNAQLKEALDDGRLRIYPIDLLNSAARHLQGSVPAGDKEGEEVQAPGVADAAGKDDTFDVFRNDLTDYLNSNEYFLAFMRDSLRQGATLSRETAQHCSGRSVALFTSNREALEEQAARTAEKLEVARQLAGQHHQGVFDRRRKDCESRAAQLARELGQSASASVEKLVQRWSETGDSLRELLQMYCTPLHEDTAAKVAAESRDFTASLVGMQSAGAEFPLEALETIDALEIPLAEIGRNALQKMDAAPQRGACEIDLDITSIPVRKSIIDWILFRNQDSVRRRILGSEGDLSQPIPADVKQKRLGEEGLRVIRDLCIDWLQLQQAKIPFASTEQAIGGYVGGFLEELQQRVEAAERALEGELDRLRARMQSNGRISEALENLRALTSRIDERIKTLKGNCESGTEPPSGTSPSAASPSAAPGNTGAGNPAGADRPAAAPQPSKLKVPGILHSIVP